MIASIAPRYGGPSAALPAMCRALAARGHEVELWTTNIDGHSALPVPLGEPIASDGFTTTYYPARWPRRYGTSPALARALFRRVGEFDVVHIHSLYLFHTAVAAFCCRRHGVPYVIRPHGTLDAYHRARHRGRKALYEWLVERRNLNRAAGIHYTSRAEQQQAEAHGVTAPGFVVPLAVDIEDFERPACPDDLLRRFPELVDRRLVTFMGRLAAKKSLDILIDAFALIAEQPDAHLVLAGPDDEGLGSRLAEQVRRLGLRSRVTFAGFVGGEAKVALLQRSSAFALPSADENFAVSVVEAMAAGTPVVVTQGVAIHEEIADAGAGWVVARTPQAVANAVIRALADPNLIAAMGNRGRELVRRSYSWAAAAQGLEDLYRTVRERNRATGDPRDQSAAAVV